MAINKYKEENKNTKKWIMKFKKLINNNDNIIFILEMEIELFLLFLDKKKKSVIWIC